MILHKTDIKALSLSVIPEEFLPVGLETLSLPR